MRRLVLFLAVLCALGWPDSSAAEDANGTWTWGLAAGVPQTVAVTAERRGESSARLQLHGGTVVVASSLGVRAVIISRDGGFAPYAFIGAGMLHVAEGEGGGGTGWTGYAWGGAGLRVPTGPLAWFTELGVVLGMDTGQGYSSAVPAVAIGVAFGRR